MLDLKGHRITYFGHSTFSLTTPSGQVAIIDPWLMTNPVCPAALKSVPRLDVIFLTHAHGDHWATCWRSPSSTSRRLWRSSRRACGSKARDLESKPARWEKVVRKRRASLK